MLFSRKKSEGKLRNKYWKYLSVEHLKIFECQNFVWFPFHLLFLPEFEIEGLELFPSTCCVISVSLRMFAIDSRLWSTFLSNSCKQVDFSVTYTVTAPYGSLLNHWPVCYICEQHKLMVPLVVLFLGGLICFWLE